MKLNAEHCNIKVQVELSEDADIYEVFEALRTLAIGMTYHEDNFYNAALQYVEDHTKGGIGLAVPKE